MTSIDVNNGMTLEYDILRARLGKNAQHRALETHLGDTHLEKWVGVVAAVMSPDD